MPDKPDNPSAGGHMKRITCSSITDTLIQASEDADEFESVLVLAWLKNAEGARFFSDGNITIAEANLLVDLFKDFLLRQGGGNWDDDDAGEDR